MERAPPALRPIAAALLLLGAAVALLAFQSSCFFETWTDENVHLYVAGRLAQGAVLYRDIQSARPPLALAPLAALVRLGLAPLLAARAAVVLALLSTALVLLLAGRRLFGAWAGVAAAALFLLAPEVAARHSFTAIHQVALLSTLCVVLALLERPLLSGLAAGLALVCGQHAAVLLAGTALLIGLRRPRELPRFAAGALLALGAVFGAAVARAGWHPVWQDLVGRHLYHLGGAGAAAPASEGDLGWYLASAGLENLALLLLAAAALLPSPSGAPEAPPRGIPLPLGLPLPGPDRLALAMLASAHLAVVALMRGGLILYVFPALPLLALLAGDGLVRAACWCAGAPLRRSLPLAAALLGLTLGALLVTQRRYQQRDQLDYPLLPHARQLAMARLQRLTVAESITAAIGPELLPQQTLFGFPTITAAVAVKAGRRISGELADLAPRWLQQGTVDRREVVALAERDRVAFFLTPRGFYEHDPFFRAYLAQCYEAPRLFARALGDGRGVPPIDVFRHRPGITCAAR